MWIGRRRSWIAMVITGGVTLPNIWPRTLTVTAISVAVTIAYLRLPALHLSITSTPFVLIGLPLGIFLGFRNNSAYDRFWEGRRLWGQLVNTSRSLARQVLTLVDAPPDREEEGRAFGVAIVHLQIAYAHALRHHLRDADPFATLRAILPADEVEKLRDEENVPIAIAQRLGERFAEARRKGWIHAMHAPVLEQSLTSMTDIQGACERIKSTPVPYSYAVLMHRIVGVYCCLLPVGLAETIGMATPGVVLGVSYALFGLDAVGDELEQPFGLDVNDLPLEAISTTIETNLRRRIGEPAPPPVKPKDGVLR